MEARYRVIMLGSILAVALAISGTFAAATSAMGIYTSTDIAIGFVWFFTISFLVSTPLLIPRLRRRLGTR